MLTPLKTLFQDSLSWIENEATCVSIQVHRNYIVMVSGFCITEGSTPAYAGLKISFVSRIGFHKSAKAAKRAESTIVWVEYKQKVGGVNRGMGGV